MQPVILEMQEIDKSFAGTHALRHLSFALREGEVHALLGENGAGKSTLIKILGGVYQPDSGQISIHGEKVDIGNVQDAQRHGIGIIHQEIVLVPHLNVAENIFLGREICRKGLRDKAEMLRRGQEMMGQLDLDINVSTLVSRLTIAQRQMVEIVKAINFNVRILVMDEPTSSLSEKEVRILFDTIAKLKRQGVSIIYISHRLEELFTISDRVTVIRDGQYIGTRETGETDAEELVRMMVGRSIENFYVRDYHDAEQQEVVFSVRGAGKKGVFEDVSFQVHKGEILGFAGLVGAGRSELMLALFGANGYDSGEVLFDGKAVHFQRTQDAVKSQVCMVPENRKTQGLVLCNSVSYNITLAALRDMMAGPFLNKKKQRGVVRQMWDRLRIRAASVDTPVRSLSGGNQQKVLVAKWLAARPKLLILDEPTRGIDVGAKQEIYGIINELAKQGLAIILISSDLPEIINMADRVCVMRQGRIEGTLQREELSQENIMKYATGGGNGIKQGATAG